MEPAQMWLPTRYASTLDMLANTVGAMLGALLGLLLTVSDRLTGWAAEYVSAGWSVVPPAI